MRYLVVTNGAGARAHGSRTPHAASAPGALCNLAAAPVVGGRGSGGVWSEGVGGVGARGQLPGRGLSWSGAAGSASGRTGEEEKHAPRVAGLWAPVHAHSPLCRPAPPAPHSTPYATYTSNPPPRSGVFLCTNPCNPPPHLVNTQHKIPHSLVPIPAIPLLRFLVAPALLKYNKECNSPPPPLLLPRGTQLEYERAGAAMGGYNFTAPVQRVTDFMSGGVASGRGARGARRARGEAGDYGPAGEAGLCAWAQ